MLQEIKVLDHGFVRLVESWGGGDYQEDFDDLEREAGIIEAARQSTQGSFRGWEKDVKLLKYLYDFKHSTPFEFAGMVIEVKAPIFIFRQWQRHRTQSYNEMSARYGTVPNENYIPSVKRLVDASLIANEKNNRKKNKQVGTVDGASIVNPQIAERIQAQLETEYGRAEELYQEYLKAGVPKELARIGMPVGRYSQMRASASLRNWLAFLTLRLDPHAQWEIQEYAKAVASLIEQEFPQTYKLFVDGQENPTTD